jgi:hypothetical protein
MRMPLKVNSCAVEGSANLEKYATTLNKYKKLGATSCAEVLYRAPRCDGFHCREFGKVHLGTEALCAQARRGVPRF